MTSNPKLTMKESFLAVSDGAASSQAKTDAHKNKDALNKIQARECYSSIIKNSKCGHEHTTDSPLDILSRLDGSRRLSDRVRERERLNAEKSNLKELRI